MFSFIFSLLIGALAGSIAGRIMGSETSALRNIVLGILGSFVGGTLFGLVGLSATGLVVRSSSRSSEPVSASGLAASCSSKQSILKMPQLSGVKAVVFSFLTDVIFSRTML